MPIATPLFFNTVGGRSVAPVSAAQTVAGDEELLQSFLDEFERVLW